MSDELEVLTTYIRTELGYEGILDEDVDLLEEQILDSFSIIQLAMYVQEAFGIELEASDLVRENLSRLSAVVALVHRYRSAEVK